MNERKLALSKKWPKCTMLTFTTSIPYDIYYNQLYKRIKSVVMKLQTGSLLEFHAINYSYELSVAINDFRFRKNQCRSQGYVHAAPFLHKSGEKNTRFCAFTLLTKADKNLSVFVIYDRSHCSVFVKLHRGAEALTLISALKLIVANSLIRKTGKT